MKVKITKIKKLFNNHVTTFKEGDSMTGNLSAPIKLHKPVILHLFDHNEIICNRVSEIIDNEHFNSNFSKFKLKYYDK